MSTRNLSELNRLVDERRSATRIPSPGQFHTGRHRLRSGRNANFLYWRSVPRQELERAATRGAPLPLSLDAAP